jgi:hypothetical protein
MARLNDYSATLPRQTVTIQRPAGPLVTPLVGPKESQQKGVAEVVDRLDRMIKVLQLMPEAIQAQFRKSYLESGRDQQAFCVTPSASVALAGFATATVLSFTVRNNFEGAILSMGFNVTPITSLQDVKWYLKINGNLVHPGFDGVTFFSSEIARHVPFQYELLQNRTVSIVAQNTLVNPITVDARLSGYTAYLAEWKRWGDAPKSGL